ncbi:MAG: hypothetical protein JW874_14845 [Spirochaetales bacterium]|nr:hypothetical protein [Spirochaetales bacterium]
MFKEAMKKQEFDIQNKKMRAYLYLDLSIDELIDTMNSLEFSDIGEDAEVPFTASMRGYKGARDQEGCSWLLKEIPENEAFDHKLQEIAYYIDFLLNTLAAPNILKIMDGKYYRVTKNIKSAMQISSYNYVEEPFKSILASDLINRWLFFDEDRNPNNYLVFHDTDNSPHIIAIDYNKADLAARELKISGRDDRFGWNRLEKTRFLTLLQPEHFDNLPIDVFDRRLKDLMGLSEQLLVYITEKSITRCCAGLEKAREIIEIVPENIKMRREYINAYFRKWFHERDKARDKEEDDRYSGFGKSFLDYYKGKK